MSRSRLTPSRAALAKGRDRLRYRAQPGWIPPMLATLSDRAPTGAGWVYEPKLDGVRVLAYVTGGAVRLFSRNRKQVEGGYPELVEALTAAVRGDAVLDGEIVAPDPVTGLSSFARLQQRMHLRDVERAARTGVSVELYLFDCLFYEGIDLTGLPLLDRKKVLRDVVGYDGPIRFTPHRSHGLRGDVPRGLRARSRGHPGQAGGRALRERAQRRLAQDQVRPGAGVRHRRLHRAAGRADTSRRPAGGLLRRRQAAVRGQGRHRIRPAHAEAALRPSWLLFTGGRRRSRPARCRPGDVRWVTPKLVAQIGFGEWTEAGLLRHPRFIGLRDDKAPREVRREG